MSGQYDFDKWNNFGKNGNVYDSNGNLVKATDTSEKQIAKRARKVNIMVITFVVVFVAIVLLIMAAFNNGAGTSNMDSDINNTGNIIAAAEQIVKENLKAPSTAKFPWSYSEFKVTNNNGKCKVSGYVDSENSFGAMVRTSWTATFELEYDGNGILIKNDSVSFY